MPTEKAPSPKSEAIRSLNHVIEQVSAPETLGPLEWRLIKATLQHAKEQVIQIQELKQPRRVRPSTPAAVTS